MHSGNRRGGFHFENELVVYQQVGSVRTNDGLVVPYRDWRLSDSTMPSLSELDFQCSHVNVLEKSIAEPIVDGVKAANCRACELLEQKSHGLVRVSFRLV